MHPFNPEILAYIALENPRGVDEVFIRRNYDPPQTYEERIAALVQIIEIEGEKIHPEIWALHPGRRKPQTDHGESCFCGSCSSANYTGEVGPIPTEATSLEPKTPPNDRDWIKEQLAASKRHLMFATAGLACLIILVATLTRNG